MGRVYEYLRKLEDIDDDDYLLTDEALDEYEYDYEQYKKEKENERRQERINVSRFLGHQTCI